jgi:hypothetical protein
MGLTGYSHAARGGYNRRAIRRHALPRVLHGALPGVLVMTMATTEEAGSVAIPIAGDAAQAARFATLALAGLDREYPNKPNEVLRDAADLKSPRALHPAFWGHFDWHSSVHAHWMLVRLLRLYPALPDAAAIRARLAEHLTPAHLQAEADYFRVPENRGFERMYGWAWALRLAQELRAWDDPDARAWSAALVPLEQAVVALVHDYLPRLGYPVRSGVHPDTAFALGMMLDCARAAGDGALAALIEQRARDFYAADRDYPVDFEPSGQDFLSPGLNVMDLMRRVLPRRRFSTWLNRFAPGLRRGRLGAWSRVAVAGDLDDPQIVHLVGLNLSRAWSMQGVVSVLDPRDRRHGNLERAMHAHAEAGLAQVFSGSYEGEHWLASFAVYYLTGAGLAAQP